MLLAIPCHAQSRRSGSRGRSGMSRGTFFQLLAMPPVHKELDLRKLQIEMLGDLRSDMSDQFRAAFSSGGRGRPRGPGGSEGSQRTRDRDNAVQKIRVRGEKLASVILDADQTKRFHQVRLQYEGTRALSRRPFRDQLGVTDEQFKKIEVLLPAPDDRSTLGRPEKNLDESVLALLSEEQQVKFKELRGETFELPLQLSPRFRSR